MLLIIAFNVAPLLLLALALWRYRNEFPPLAAWRKRPFILALAAIATSATILATFSAHALLINAGMIKEADLDRVYPVFSMLGLGFLGFILASFGQRTSRSLLMIDGIALVLFWYFAALAASP
jgi:hypothetical protein